MSTPILPNFIIVGAPRSGTSSLHTWLKQHPDIFMSEPKEPHYFVKRRGIETWDEYVALFAAAGGKKAIGEASVSYLASPESAQWIIDSLGRVKIVAFLREPAERVFSGYSSMLTRGKETARTFEEALARETKWSTARGYDVNLPRGYYASGFYADNVQRFIDVFGREHVYVMLFDEFMKDRAAGYHALCTFLGVDDTFTPEFIRENTTYLPRSVKLQHALKSLRDNVSAAPVEMFTRFAMHWNTRLGRNKPKLAPELRATLREFYRSDVEKLAGILGRDMSNWLNAPGAAVERRAARKLPHEIAIASR